MKRQTQAEPRSTRLANCILSGLGQHRLANDPKGAVAVMFGAVMAVLISFAALAIDAAFWQAGKSSLQGVADAAAYAAALSASDGDPASRSQAEALAVAAAAGFVGGQGGVAVAAHAQPSTGNYAGNPKAWEVIIQQAQSQFFSGAMVSSGPVISARGVALVTPLPGCIYTLSQTAPTGLAVLGSGTVDLQYCTVFDNSLSSSALTTAGPFMFSNLKTISFAAANPIVPGSVPAATIIKAGQNPANDPYAGRSIPSYSGCDYTNYQVDNGAAATLPNAGAVTIFCNGINFSGGGAVTVPAGIYIIDGGDFKVTGAYTITGTDVTFIVTNSTGANYGTINFSGPTTTTLSAPKTGPSAGIVLWLDSNAPPGTRATINDVSNSAINGAVYLPTADLSYAGGSIGANCTTLIASTIAASGLSANGSTCNGVNYAGTPLAVTATVVE